MNLAILGAMTGVLHLLQERRNEQDRIALGCERALAHAGAMLGMYAALDEHPLDSPAAIHFLHVFQFSSAVLVRYCRARGFPVVEDA